MSDPAVPPFEAFDDPFFAAAAAESNADAARTRAAERLLEGLNTAQVDAVSADAGPVLVLAGPGSGKTRVLTHRVAWLVDVFGVAPWQIMAVTFTNKAAREMRGRLERLIGPTALGQVTIGTFHAICARLLRREAETLPVDGNFVIFDSDDQERVVKRALDELNLDPKQYRPAAILGAISSAKSELLRPADYHPPTYWHEIAGRVYARYQQLLQASNALDFDDLLLETAELLRHNAAVRDRYRDRYRHVLVDEFQDTNTAQYAIVKALAAAEVPEAPHNLFAVGDEDQSIYRWRGADWRNIERFRRDFPAARTILLEQNYRSTQTILDAARAVIDQNAHRTPKALWTERGPGQGLLLFEAYDEAEEAAFVVHQIEQHVRRGGRFGELAVMYRTNAQSRTIEDALVRKRIPYQLVGGTRFYDRREIRDVLAYLRLVHNPLDEIALQRVINVPARGIGDKAMATLAAAAVACGVPFWPALQLIADGSLADISPAAAAVAIDNRTRNALGAFHDLLARLIAAREQLDVTALLGLILDSTGYARHLRDGTDEGEERWENVVELRNVAVDFEAMAPREGLAALLESVALVADVDALDGASAADRVTLLTLHAAKGLEFPTVIITGLEEGSIPHSRSVDDPDGLAEERRLFYVGLTRAERTLILVRAHRRTVYGATDVREPSRFLLDLPTQVLAEAPPARGVRGAPAHSRGTQWPDARRSGARPAPGAPAGPGRPATPAGAAAATFRPGDKVTHGTFGEGVVVSAVQRDGDEEVTVAFVGAGVKKLMQSFARLERVR